MPSGSGFVAIASGAYHSMALKSDGSIVVWGWDNDSQVSHTPSATNFTSKMDGGEHSALAITDDGNIVGWGGDFSEVLSKLSVLNNENSFTDVSAGAGIVFALVE